MNQLYIHVCVCCAVASVVSDSATPWAVALQAPLSMGFSKQQYWSGLPCPPPGALLKPGIKPTSLVSCTGRRVLYHKHHQGSPHTHISTLFFRFIPQQTITECWVETITFSVITTWDNTTLVYNFIPGLWCDSLQDFLKRGFNISNSEYKKDFKNHSSSSHTMQPHCNDMWLKR